MSGTASERESASLRSRITHSLVHDVGALVALGHVFNPPSPSDGLNLLRHPAPCHTHCERFSHASLHRNCALTGALVHRSFLHKAMCV